MNVNNPKGKGALARNYVRQHVVMVNVPSATGLFIWNFKLPATEFAHPCHLIRENNEFLLQIIKSFPIGGCRVLSFIFRSSSSFFPSNNNRVRRGVIPQIWHASA
jgi:hypothetical protein